MAAIPSSRSGTALRVRILQVATGLFAERGFGATSMRDIAEQAGCTKPAVYYYFKNKSALFLDIIRHETTAVVEHVERALAGPGSIRDRMRRAMAVHFERVRTNPMALAVIMRAELRAERGLPEYDFRSLRAMYLALGRRVLEEGKARGEIRGDVDPDDAMLALVGMIDQRCVLWVLEREPIPEDYPDRILALLFGGLAP